MPDWVDGASFWPLFVFFAAIAWIRTLVTYLVARFVTTWTVGRPTSDHRVLARIQAWLTGPSAERGTQVLARWGLVAIPASFLMTGTKTIVNGAAGILRVPFGRYLAMMTLGALIHGTIYATIGWAAWTAALAAATGSPAGVAALASLIVVIVVVVLLHRRASRPAESEPAAVPGSQE